MFVERASAPLGRFRDEAARARFARAADALAATWARPPQPIDVPTGFGLTRVNAAATTGTIGAGQAPPVVLLPMVGVTSLSWGPTIAALERSPTHRRIYAVDLITDAGMGRAERPITNGGDTAAWLDEVLDGLGLERVHLVGHSYGALVALNHALASPERLASVVAVEPLGAITLLRRATRARARATPLTRGFRGPRWRRRHVATRTARRLVPSSVAHREQLVDLLTSGAVDFRGRQLRPRLVDDTELDRIVTTPPPSLVLLGGRSAMCPTDRIVERLRARNPEPELVNRVEVMPDAGHAIPIEQPDAFSRRLLWFLDIVDRADDRR